MFYPTSSCGCAMSSYILQVYITFYLEPLTACLHYAVERFWNGSYCSVNGRGMVLKRTALGEMVPPRVGGPNQSRTVPLTSENDTACKLLFTPLVSHVTW